MTTRELSACIRVPALIWALFIAHPVAADYAYAPDVHWRDVVKEYLVDDWDALRTSITAFEPPDKATVLLRTKLIVHDDTEEKDENICSQTSTPAYTEITENQTPVIHFCIWNYGYLMDLADSIAYAQLFYGYRLDPDFGKIDKIISSYESYLARSAIEENLANDLRMESVGHCNPGPFLYMFEQGLDYMRCGDFYVHSSVSPEMRNWHLTYAFFPYFKLWFEKNFLRPATLIDYDNMRGKLALSYFRWSYRAVLLHEFGHIATGDIGLEGGNEEAEIKDDDAAINFATKISGDAPSVRATVLNTLSRSEYYLTELSALLRGRELKWSAARIQHITRQADAAQQSLSKEPQQQQSFGFGAFRSPFLMCGTNYGRTLKESFVYVCPDAYVELLYLSSYKTKPFLPPSGRNKSSFQCNMWCIPH
ncbi:hypothetical protein [Caballeronia sp. BCC1704]|uniref:hypothetical protein n=1 Tax=Caballeronia sp. BCC1704 TaxID=2676300 RepID=UPI00158AC5BB|nr:hypothetical protein [Caballeronia sp. BCC1704]